MNQMIMNLCLVLRDKPEYRDTITSQDIYDAVLDFGVNTLEGFFSYVEKRGQR